MTSIRNLHRQQSGLVVLQHCAHISSCYCNVQGTYSQKKMTRISFKNLAYYSGRTVLVGSVLFTVFSLYYFSQTGSLWTDTACVRPLYQIPMPLSSAPQGNLATDSSSGERQNGDLGVISTKSGSIRFSSSPQPNSTVSPGKEPPTSEQPVVDSGSFHKINQSEIWVYSAFYEPVKTDHERPGIRAMGLAPTTSNWAQIFCHLVFDDVISKTVEGYMKVVLDHHGMPYSAVFLSCPLTADERPKYVAFSRLENDTDGHQFELMYPAPQRLRTFTVCYGVLHANYDRLSTMLQSITFNRVMGAEHFYIYNQTSGPSVNALLRHHQDRGLMTVQDMAAFPVDKSWYHGQIMAICDCLYRNRNVSEFVLVVDQDEFVTPLTPHTSWKELVDAVVEEEVKENRKPNVGSFSVLHSMYCNNRLNSTQWSQFRKQFSITDEDEKFIRKYNVFPFLEVKRVGITPFPNRCKTIYRPEFANIPGIHYPRGLWSGQRNVVVNKTLAIVGHFRNRKANCFIDTSIARFYSPYMGTLRKTYNDFHEYLSNKNISLNAFRPEEE